MVRARVSTAAAAVLLIVAATGSQAADPGQQAPDQWRASKYVGTPIYGPGNRDVGKVTDILLSRDGKAQSVVIGVGGFLGLGQKDVAVPYGDVQFTDEPIAPPPNPAPNNNLASTAPNPTGAPAASATSSVVPTPEVGLGTPSPAMPDTAAGGSGAAHSTAYPDHGTITMTAEDLKSAPAFHFGR